MEVGSTYERHFGGVGDWCAEVDSKDNSRSIRTFVQCAYVIQNLYIKIVEFADRVPEPCTTSVFGSEVAHASSASFSRRRSIAKLFRCCKSLILNLKFSYISKMVFRLLVAHA